MKSAVLSRLIMFTLVCAGAGYIVVANTTPATSVAAISRPDFSSAIVQTPLASQPLQHTVEVNLPPAQVNALAKANQPHAKFDDAAPHGPHDDLLALLATPEVEVSRPRSPFLERLPRLYEAKPVAKSAPPKATAREYQPTKVKAKKGRRVRNTNPFASMWQPKFRAFGADNPFRQSNQSMFGSRASKRRTATVSY
jgi:hypothetical protein